MVNNIESWRKTVVFFRGEQNILSLFHNIYISQGILLIRYTSKTKPERPSMVLIWRLSDRKIDLNNIFAYRNVSLSGSVDDSV